MFEEFFNNCEIHAPVTVSDDQSEKIKSSLKKRLAGDHPRPEQPVKEEKAMKKATTIRAVLLAATVAAAGAISLIGSANTVPVNEFTAPESSVTENNIPDEKETLSEYDYFYAQMDEKHPNMRDEVKADFANFYAEIGRERLAELDNFYDQLEKEYHGDEERLAAERAEEARIGAELAEKNTITEEYRNYLKTHYIMDKFNVDFDDVTDEDIADLNVTDAELNNLHFVPTYEDMDITELIVGETTYNQFKGMSLSFVDWGITLDHMEPWGGGGSVLIHPDGNGGYQYYKYNDSAPIEDEQLLAAIAEGTEKYGDTFTIYY